MWTIPNLLSLSRLPLTIVLLVCVEFENWPLALLVFAVSMLTDWLDGWWARRYRQRSMLGRNLDPLTDKVLIGGALIYLIDVEGTGITRWMVAVVICRELLITGIRGIVETCGKSFGADWFGKLKTVLQTLTLLGIFLILALHEANWLIHLWPTLDLIQIVILYSMLVATVGSGVQYCVKAAYALHDISDPLE
jgi:CDP-diacylglycerol---glycerol-3-phosphate 3-phosphatidyltransferase